MKFFLHCGCCSKFVLVAVLGRDPVPNQSHIKGDRDSVPLSSLLSLHASVLPHGDWLTHPETQGVLAWSGSEKDDGEICKYLCPCSEGQLPGHFLESWGSLTCQWKRWCGNLYCLDLSVSRSKMTGKSLLSVCLLAQRVVVQWWCWGQDQEVCVIFRCRNFYFGS